MGKYKFNSNIIFEEKMEPNLNAFEWNPITNQNEVDELNELFCDFNQAIFVDLKYFSADQVDFEVPGDTSEESHCYIKFQSFDPRIADNKNRNEIVMKFTGIRQLGVMSGKLNKGNLVGVNFSQGEDGSIMLEIYNNDQNLDENLSGQTPPSFICADTVGWNYDFGDDIK